MDVEFVRYKYENSHDGVFTQSKFKLGVRHLQMIYMFACSLAMGIIRSSTGIAVLAITDHTRENETYLQIHDWNMRIQGSVLSSFLFGYALMFIPAEMCLKQMEDKSLLTATLLTNGGLAAAMPTIVDKGGWIAICNAEFLLGMSQAFISPVNQKLISNWLPPGERSVFSFIIQGANIFGIILALPISGRLSESRLGWELIFYSQAMMGLSMAAIWGLLTASSPDQHQAIGENEKEFIKEARASYHEKKLQQPWLRILRTKQYWAIAVAHSAANIIFVFFLFEVPAFLKSLGLSIEECSWRAAGPLAAMWAVYLTTSPVVELVHRVARVAYLFDVKYFRKMINGLGTFGTIIGLTIVPNLVSNWNHWGLVALWGALGALGLQLSGFLENHRDMTQNYSGTLLMMTSVPANVFGAMVPFITGLVVGDEAMNKKTWKIMFLSLAGLYLLCNGMYTMFASSERQEWDGSRDQKFGYSNDASSLELEELSQTKRKRDADEDTTV